MNKLTCLPALALLLVGCGANSTHDDGSASSPSPSSSPAAVMPTESTPSLVPASDTLPALPHQGSWGTAALDRSPLATTCGKPPAALRDAAATSLSGVVDPGPRGGFESLGVYADAAAAAGDVDDWRRRLTHCDGTVGSESPDGIPLVWYVSPVDVPGTDEAWFALGQPADESAADEPYAVTVRVGDAVYTEGVDHPGRLREPQVQKALRSTAAEAATVVQSLRDHASTDPVPDVPSTGPDAVIPGDVRLPGDGSSLYRGFSGSVPFPRWCIDPPAREVIRDPQDTVTLGEPGVGPAESLSLYPTAADATRAVTAWRDQLDSCTGPQALTEIGTPYDFDLDRVTVPGADEVWFAHDVQGEDSPAFDVLVRVGNVLYFADTHGDGRFTDDEVRDLTDERVDQLTDYLPSLARFR